MYRSHCKKNYLRDLAYLFILVFLDSISYFFVGLLYHSNEMIFSFKTFSATILVIFLSSAINGFVDKTETDNIELQRMSSIKSEKQDVLDRVNQKSKVWFFGKYLVRSLEKEYGNVNELKKSIENLDKELVFVEKHKEEKMSLYNACSTKLEEIKSKMEIYKQDEVDSRKKLAVLNEFNRIEDMFLD